MKILRTMAWVVPVALVTLLVAAGVLMATSGSTRGQSVADGWYKAGTFPDDYFMGIDAGSGPEGANVATVRSTAWWPKGFGTLMQDFAPGELSGKRVRFAASVRSENVASWAGLWMRVDGPGGRMLSLENMHNRPIQGTTDWAHHEVVLDVPEEAVNVAFGILLNGKGQVWMTALTVEAVSGETPTTDRGSNGPVGL